MFYIIISALLFTLPYILPIFSPLLFIALSPLILYAQQNQVTFKHGFIWGIFVFSGQLFWLLWLIIIRGKGICKIGVWLLTLGWFCLWTGIWIWFTSYLYKTFYKNSIIRSFILTWLISTLLYFYFIINISLFPGGIIEGWTFFNPLVPLTYYPHLIWCVHWLGIYKTLLCLMLFQLFLVIGYIYKQNKYYLYSVIFVLPFLTGFIFYTPIKFDTSHLYFVKPWWHRSTDPIFVGYRMVHDITKIICNNHHVKAIIMPESTFGWNLYEYQKFIPMMCECAEDIPIIFGSQRQVNGSLKNTCFIIQNGNIVWTYDKTHLMPLTERIPTLLPYELFTSKEDVFEYGDQQQNDIIKLYDTQFQIFICSELFSQAKYIKGIPILFIYNDDWLCCTYSKNLALLFIKYISIKHNIPIVSCKVSSS